jgi:flagellar motor switch protein FliN/FliY
MSNTHDMDIPIIVNVATKQAFTQDIQKMRSGTIIEFKKRCGEPLDVMANNVKIARGEVITVNGKFGVQLRDVIGEKKNHK